MNGIQWLLNPPTPPEHKGRRVMKLSICGERPNRAKEIKVSAHRAKSLADRAKVIEVLEFYGPLLRPEIDEKLNWDHRRLRNAIEHLSAASAIHNVRLPNGHPGRWHISETVE